MPSTVLVCSREDEADLAHCRVQAVCTCLQAGATLLSQHWQGKSVVTFLGCRLPRHLLQLRCRASRATEVAVVQIRGLLEAVQLLQGPAGSVSGEGPPLAPWAAELGLDVELGQQVVVAVDLQAQAVVNNRSATWSRRATSDCAGTGRICVCLPRGSTSAPAPQRHRTPKDRSCRGHVSSWARVYGVPELVAQRVRHGMSPAGRILLQLPFAQAREASAIWVPISLPRE